MITGINYWSQKKEAVYIVHAVEEFPVQGFQSGEVYQFSKIVDQSTECQKQEQDKYLIGMADSGYGWGFFAVICSLVHLSFFA